MAKKVRFKRLVRKDDDLEVLAITLHQKRQDEKGNRIPGHSFEEIRAMAPFALIRRRRSPPSGCCSEGGRPPFSGNGAMTVERRSALLFRFHH